MDDTISRQAALDALPKKQKGIGGESWMKTYRRSGYNDCVEDCMKALQALPSAQPDVPDTNVGGNLIDRQAAINAICEDGTQRERQGQYSMTMVDRKYRDIEILEALPPAQQTTLTADDIETIRIHLSAFKEKLCNQGRWTEAAEYERLIQRLTGKGDRTMVLIDMDKPKDCVHCPICNADGDCLIVPGAELQETYEEQYALCPLKEVQT